MKMSSISTFDVLYTASVQNWLCTKRTPDITKPVLLRRTKLIGRPGKLLTPFVKSYLENQG
jgi:hypothetical protein